MKTFLALLACLAVGAVLVLAMTRPFGGGEAAVARNACVKINTYAAAARYDAREEMRVARSVASPTPTPGVAEVVRGSKERGAGGPAQLRRLATYCVSRGYGPTPTP